MVVRLFQPLVSDDYSMGEKMALGSLVFVALAGLAYAWMLVGQVKKRPRRARRGCRRSPAAVREGANAYLYRQFRVVGVLIVLITILLLLCGHMHRSPNGNLLGAGRSPSSIGSIFSATVGFVGMRLATVGNLRVAAAAQTSFGQSLATGLPHRHDHRHVDRRPGAVGRLDDFPGLRRARLRGPAWASASAARCLALFMRVGGGIYTKAADVGADLVGKVEAGIPEDDPRNAATIADNVGDNVGDCAGMAADIFESYEVTIVAAMILGIASFGHKGVIFPLLVRAIGVIASIISTYSVRAGDKGNVAEAMRSVNRGFIIGSTLSVVGFIVLGLGYLHSTTPTSSSTRRLRPASIGADGRGPAPADPPWSRKRRRLAFRPPGGKRYRRSAAMGDLGHDRARHASGLDLPDRHHPGRVPQQVHGILYRHRILAGEEPGQSLRNGPCHEHHPRLGRGL